MTHLEQLEQWWGESADSFPGDFVEWLFNRINAGESESLEADLECLVNELKINAISNVK